MADASPPPAAPTCCGITYERLLVLLMRLLAVVMQLAVVGIFLPRSMMDAGHRWLFGTPLPDSPAFDYLARTVSFFWAFHGALLWLISTDLKRLAPVLLFVIWADVVLGVVISGVGWVSGMPWWWIVAEGPGTLVHALLMLFLWGQVKKGLRLEA